MQKIINIDGRPVKFDSSLGFVFQFRKQFSLDPFALFVPLIKAATPVFTKGVKELDASELNEALDALYDINLTDMLGLIWAMAKNANRDIDPPDEWYATFSEFPLDTVGREIVFMALESFVSKKKAEEIKNLLKVGK